MQEEWGNDEGLSTARKYCDGLVSAYRAARGRMDSFKPDFVLIFGDDQYENFKEDLLPPFCIFAVKEAIESRRRGRPITIRGHSEAGNHIARELIRRGFDVGCSWRLRQQSGYGHAFTTTIRALDPEGAGFPYPVVPVSVNCYGSDLRVPNEKYLDAQRLGRRFEDVPVPPPPSPMPWRCYDLGRAVAEILRASPWRVVIIGSSSWSHASLTTKNYYLWPDVEADRARRAELEAGEHAKWRDLDPQQIIDSGQHEILNWICLAGAMEGRRAEIIHYAEAYIANSSKCICVFPT
jgi:hypothetical protein